jgi:copper chaperone CopZ
MSFLVLPGLAAMFLAVSYFVTPLFEVPTFERVINGAPAKTVQKEIIVSGLSCKGRSLMLYENLRYLPGVRSMKTFARKRRLVLEYDPAQLSREDIKECIEGTMRDPETGEESAPFRVQP